MKQEINIEIKILLKIYLNTYKLINILSKKKYLKNKP